MTRGQINTVLRTAQRMQRQALESDQAEVSIDVRRIDFETRHELVIEVWARNHGKTWRDEDGEAHNFLSAHFYSNEEMTDAEVDDELYKVDRWLFSPATREQIEG